MGRLFNLRVELLPSRGYPRTTLNCARRQGQNPSLRPGAESRQTIYSERGGVEGLRELLRVQLVGGGVGEIDL